MASKSIVKSSTVTFGSDPEFFLKDTKTNNLVPAFGKLGGAKGSGINFHDNGSHMPKASRFSKYLEDGAAVELNLPITNHLHHQLGIILDHAGFFQSKVLKLIEGGRYAFAFSPMIKLPKESLDHPLAKQLGCVEDRDAYQDGAPRRPFTPADFGTTRYAGCHLHFGLHPWPTGLPKHIFVKFLDLFLGTILHRVDDQKERRQYYGLPGLYRETNYGVEYRTPSISLMENLRSNTEFFQVMATTCETFVYTCALNRESMLECLDDIYTNVVDWARLKEVLSKDTMTTPELNWVKKTTDGAISKLGIYRNQGMMNYFTRIPIFRSPPSNKDNTAQAAA
jgi:hypothetical protein